MDPTIDSNRDPDQDPNSLDPDPDPALDSCMDPGLKMTSMDAWI